jgi:hypothetical protein
LAVEEQGWDHGLRGRIPIKLFNYFICQPVVQKILALALIISILRQQYYATHGSIDEQARKVPDSTVH